MAAARNSVELRRTVHQISFCPVQQRVAIDRPTKHIHDFSLRPVAYEIFKLESQFMRSVARRTAKPGSSLTSKEEKAYVYQGKLEEKAYV